MKETKTFFTNLISHPAFLAWMAIPFFFTGTANAFNENPPAVNEYVAYKTSCVPNDGIFFDAEGDEECWEDSPWYYIDQVWLPYHNCTPQELDKLYPKAMKEATSKVITGADDFSGKFKLAWNEEENLLYLLAVITDDVFVGGYVDGVGYNYSGYDVLEIFLDEDNSGGPHEDNLGEELAANAFAYHINTSTRGEGIVEEYCYAMDLIGTKEIVYSCHFPYFSFKREGNTSTYEMAIKPYIAVRDVSCIFIGPTIESPLYENKLVGFSLAYCDNDDPKKNTRDHFIGSSFLPEGKNNTNYQTADNFGTITLKGFPSGHRHNIRVTGGVANPSKAEAGTAVTITAVNASALTTFERWAGADAELLNDITSPEATFTMPEKEVAFEAIYKNIGTEEAVAGTSVLAYPNPAGEHITLSFADNQALKVSVALLAADGRLVRQLYNGEAAKELTLPLAGIGQGVYFLQITNDNESNRIKVVKN